GRDRRDVAPIIHDAAAGRVEELGQQVEAGGLAGPIGTDQRMNGPAPDLEIDPVDGHEAAKLLGQPLRLKNDVVRHAYRASTLEVLVCWCSRPSNRGRI